MRRSRIALSVLSGVAASGAIALPAGASALNPGLAASGAPSLLGFPTSARSIVVATTTPAQKTDINVQLQIREDSGPTAVATNVAVATSWFCNGCDTIAVSFEIDLVSGTTNTVVPINQSTANNYDTINSQTLAAAQQFVVATGGQNVSLSAAGQSQIEALVAGLRNEALAGAPAMTIDNDVATITSEINSILASDVTSSNATITPSVGDGGSSTVGG